MYRFEPRFIRLITESSHTAACHANDSLPELKGTGHSYTYLYSVPRKSLRSFNKTIRFVFLRVNEKISVRRYYCVNLIAKLKGQTISLLRDRDEN